MNLALGDLALGGSTLRLGEGEGTPVGPRGLVRRLGGAARPQFSICTMVTNWSEYEECWSSFRGGGFDDSRCEYLVVDNSRGNSADAYVSVNEFLQASFGDYILICHQDVLLLEHDVDHLTARLDELEAMDSTWAICGNAGHSADGWLARRISDPYGEDSKIGGPFPVKVVALDENFLVVKRRANLAASSDLRGFHHYAADLCIIGDVLGWSAYVIDFHLRHKSRGTLSSAYYEGRDAIARKYERAFRPRWIFNTVRAPFFISGLKGSAGPARLGLRLAKLLRVVPRDRDLEDPGARAASVRERGRKA